MKVLVTGAGGFIGKNLLVHLRERAGVEVLTFLKGEPLDVLAKKVPTAEFIFHLAGINRPKTEDEFFEGNLGLTNALCDAVRSCGSQAPIVYASSVQAAQDNPYGKSKRMAEDALRSLSENTDTPTYIYRLPNVFGKWCRPNYNSVVATFCHNIAHDLPIQINDPSTVVHLVYVDDVISTFLSVMDGSRSHGLYQEVTPTHNISLGDLARQLRAFKNSRNSLLMAPVGTGLPRALYSTFISYFTPDQFAYPLTKHEDPRGCFVEVLKTQDSGQFSFFTARPGVTRGGHYHHTKTEKFLVLQGEAHFCFRHIHTDETHEYRASARAPVVVESIPGWSHDITNVGNEELIVMLWANEIFDTLRPDTTSSRTTR